MNTKPNKNSRRIRRMWCVFIAATILGPFLPQIGSEIGGLRHTAGPADEWQGAILGLILWASIVMVSSAMLGWNINVNRKTGMRVLLTALFIIAASTISLGGGAPACMFVMR